MTRAEVTALGVDLETPAQSVITTGPYELSLDDTDHVVAIARRLATNHDGTPAMGSLVIDGKSVDPAIKFDALAKLVPGCKAAQINEGGNTSECDKNTVVMAAGPTGIVVIGVRAP